MSPSAREAGPPPAPGGRTPDEPPFAPAPARDHRPLEPLSVARRTGAVNCAGVAASTGRRLAESP